MDNHNHMFKLVRLADAPFNLGCSFLICVHLCSSVVKDLGRANP